MSVSENLGSEILGITVTLGSLQSLEWTGGLDWFKNYFYAC